MNVRGCNAGNKEGEKGKSTCSAALLCHGPESRMSLQCVDDYNVASQPGEFAKDKVHTHGYQRADPWIRRGSGVECAQNRVGMVSG